jgi:hypothetical protein
LARKARMRNAKARKKFFKLVFIKFEKNTSHKPMIMMM